MRRTIAAALLLLTTGCATALADRTRPLERGFGGCFSQGGARIARGDALAALDGYEPSREDARSAGRTLSGAGAFAVGGVALLTTAVVPSDLPERMRLAMAGSAVAMLYAVALPMWISAEVHEGRAARKYNAQFAPPPRTSARLRVLPLAGAVPDAAGRPAPVGGVAVAF